MTETRKGRPLVFLWENFGPYHVDRCEAVAAAAPDRNVFGFELRPDGREYSWNPAFGSGFEKIELWRGRSRSGPAGDLVAMIRAAWRIGRGSYFLCHYQRIEVLLFAWLLRLSGNNVVAMYESKFDDIPRRLRRELAKAMFFWPYNGILYGSKRSGDYARLLTGGRKHLRGGYDSVSNVRLRAMTDQLPAPDGPPFGARNFVTIARLIPKKNLATLLRAYAIYRRVALAPRRLEIYGDGPLGAALRTLARELGIDRWVDFQGFVQAPEIAAALANGLALILPSLEEQFGLAVVEAQIMGLPVIVSPACGACDELVRNGINGFVIEPDNPEGIAYFMEQLSGNEALWRKMSIRTREFVGLGDTPRFAQAALALSDTTK